jgi:outer membrane protein OmpA-like peptidoglycan-associated protein
MRSRCLAIWAALALAGCAHSSSVVLMPDEDGGHGEIGIRQADGKGGETVMNQANSRATLNGGQPTIQPLGAKGLKPNEAALWSALPPAAKSFTLYFHEGTTELTAESAGMLEQIRAEVAKRPGAEVQVTGHTDTVGSSADNDVLSRRRAEEIVNWLATKGFDRKMMSAVGRGERELKEPTADNVASAVNRRVEVLVR